MQRLAAPAREDIDRAHDAEKPMKIGSLALANFAVLSKKRLGVFFLLWASSLPLHLLFNSVVVYTSTNAEWQSYVFLDSEEELESLMSNTSALAISGVRQYNAMTEFEQTSLEDNPFLQEPYCASNRPWLISGLMTASTHSTPDPAKAGATSSSYLPAVDEDPWRWMCGYNDWNAACHAQKIMESGRWMVEDLTISRCLARRLPELCELNVSLAILIVVLVAVSIKLIAIAFAVMLGRDLSLLTIGDAIASFLEDPDKFVPPLGRLTYHSRRRMVMFEMKRAF
ncbi:hypothetical protein F4801DRAFT_601978 [Xylaria longipes]|nr:hypothetical protein F4801DRAFT_601978 [Xylaria longipes]